MQNQPFRPYQICKNCILDTSDIHIQFNNEGICDQCTDFYSHTLPYWQKKTESKQKLEKILTKIKARGRGRDFDCVIGLSGGQDSSYMLHLCVKEFDLRPLVFHVDGGWNSEQALHNIQVLVEKLGVDLFTEVINWDEMRDFQLAFFKAGVPYLDIPQDHAFVGALYRFAHRNQIKYILNGGNISTECVSRPLYYYYYGTDMSLIRDIRKKFGTVSMETFPFSSIYWHKVYLKYVKGIKVFRPLNFVAYGKDASATLLSKEYGWKPFAEKHHESRFTKFFEGYWLPKRFGLDPRRNQYSSLLLTGQLTREQALKKIGVPVYTHNEVEEDFRYISRKLRISVDELTHYLNADRKYYQNYKNQKNFFNLGAQILKLAGQEVAIKR